MIAGITHPMHANGETVVDDTAKASFELKSPETGALSIVSAADLTFNAATISVDDIVTTSSADSAIVIQEISGNAPGWKLSAQLSDFTGANKKVITGTQLFYPSVVPVTNSSASDTTSIQPVSTVDKTALTGADKGTIVSGGGDAVTIMTADSGKGYGRWTMTYPVGKVQLKIPSGNLASTYTAKLTYSLSDTVASEPAG